MEVKSVVDDSLGRIVTNLQSAFCCEELVHELQPTKPNKCMLVFLDAHDKQRNHVKIQAT
jgi:hypothetical protein